MATYELPDGRRVEVADDIVAQVQGNTPTTRKARAAIGAPRKSDTSDRDARVRRIEAGDRLTSTLPFGFGNRGIQQGVLSNFADEVKGGLSAITSGAYNAVTKRDINEIGKEYYAERDAQREASRRYSQDKPIEALVGEIGGAVVSPVGTGATALKVGSRALRAAGATRVAARARAAGSAIAKTGPVTKAVLAGANQGALNAAGSADELADVPGAIAQGGALGAGLGGVVGGGVNAARGVVRTLQKARPENVENLANERVGYLLDKAGMTPEEAARKIEVGNAQGGQVKVGDLSPGLARQEAAISRNPDVASSNDMIDLARNRIDARGNRFSEQVRETAVTPKGGDDALTRLDDINATRTGAGGNDYAKGGAMDVELPRTPELDDFFANAPKETNAALRGAYDDMLLRRENPVGVIERNPETGDITAIPNLRAMDYVKRAFDTSIGQAIKAGNRAQAQGLSSERQRLMDTLPDDYKQILGVQRDLFQKQAAVEIGENFLRAVNAEPRQFLKNVIGKLQPNQIDDARIGIIDAIINTNNKGNPVQAFKNMTRTPEQRKIMEFAFGGRSQFNRFQRYVNRELRSASTDKMVAPGGQSITGDLTAANQSGEEMTKSTLRDTLFRAFKGYGFGGGVGGVSGAIQGLAMGARKTGNLAQEEIAKILMSDGSGLAAGVNRAKAAQAASKRADQNVGRAVGKAVQQPFTTLVGN